jgi:hypothetical protein
MGGTGGGPASTVNFQAAISAAYLSYAAVMVQWRQLMRQNGALLRADTLGMWRHFAQRALGFEQSAVCASLIDPMKLDTRSVLLHLHFFIHVCIARVLIFI